MKDVLYIRKMPPANIAAATVTEKRDGIEATAADHRSVIEAENGDGIDIVTDDDREHRKIHLGGTTAAIEIKTRRDIDIEIIVATVKEDTDIHPMKQTAKNRPGGTAVEIKIDIETVGGTDIETIAATVKEDTDIHPMKQIAVGAHTDIDLEMMIQSVTVARWLGVERAL
ncbi:hypothetical protein CI102_8359 [Trichoderma harzianum]|nr:hypothetical protein CI102_8359 [Trichoderma harzianum]